MRPCGSAAAGPRSRFIGKSTSPGEEVAMSPPPWCGSFRAAEASTMFRSTSDAGVTAALCHRSGRRTAEPD
ncbi:Hypothetical protein RADP37_05486 (plasmid) [Roseomonas mucosa]|uniref:Uncharacterized protein n=1 Tax=Roseomonas mucosa TaxID=207340 RepID=A0A4Y1MRS1_9PROT|nr:Hypothetical protein RADP37_05486 [Roseomonas mucosa]